MAEVIVVGAGPTGLMLAGELSLAGVDCAVLERRTNQEVLGSRGLGLHARTIEMFDQRGIVDRFLAEGEVAQVVGFGSTRLDISDFPSRHPYGLGLRQEHTERILAEWLEELGVRVEYGQEVTEFDQDENGVNARLANGKSLRAQYIVGCDGGRSLIRKTAGIDFPGWDPTMSNLIAEVELTEEPQWGVHRHRFGTQAFNKLESGRAGLVVAERLAQQGAAPSLDELRAALVDVWGTDYGAHNPSSLSRFTDMARQAASYRSGRVFLAGDSAHVHSPVGGQGLNTGVQDAANLGWKLAQVIHGVSPDNLLDTYHQERHPVGAKVVQQNLAQTALMRVDDRVQALNETISDFLSMDEPRKSLAGMLSGLDIHYDIGQGHPLLGRRIPDLDLETANGPARVFTFLHEARPILLNLGAAHSLDCTLWAGRVKHVDARFEGVWELPVVGEVPAPTVVLIRPDGYVAWVGQGSLQGLDDSLAFWCGR
ncbi:MULTISPECIES: FAD-dependent monooxygenase [Brevibacterium]|uniref:FAD-binding domain-containing protein n=1 Tax=Brevibacterium aurantiacum TaxID=273384 RepID=A0A2A3Z0E0_BREAU|nr:MULTISPECIES: FAD-dependent monooxygenase [Brevibacterium]PCC44987.1 hypothetical protein CIK64_18030 [Brevibacterium aurantiacum]SMY04603.1 2-polyprenyl-6-methoxyphenol hydroxylase [Brevibacterium sp. 239c]